MSMLIDSRYRQFGHQADAGPELKHPGKWHRLMIREND